MCRTGGNSPGTQRRVKELGPRKLRSKDPRNNAKSQDNCQGILSQARGSFLSARDNLHMTESVGSSQSSSNSDSNNSSLSNRGSSNPNYSDQDFSIRSATNQSSSNRILVIIVVLTLALAAVAAFLTSSRDIKELTPNSPEGVVQLFLEAVIDGKNEDAARYFSSTSTCDAADIDRSWMPETVRVNLADTEIDGDKAFIEISVDISSGGPFDDYYVETHNYRLARENGSWRILGIPWPLYSCEEVTK